MSTPSGPYDPTPPSGEYPQNPPPYPGYPPYPGDAPQQSPYGQSPYGQPPYGQQPYGPPQVYPGYPGYPVPPQPQKNSNRTLWIILGVVGGVLVLACVLCVGGVFFLGSQLFNNPTIASTIAVTNFCADEESQQYVRAYNLLSSSMQSQRTQSDFIQRSQSLDTSQGTVSQCQPTTSSTNPATDTSASIPVTVMRGTGSTATTTNGTITLVKESGGWKIDSIDPSLSLT